LNERDFLAEVSPSGCGEVKLESSAKFIGKMAGDCHIMIRYYPYAYNEKWFAINVVSD